VVEGVQELGFVQEAERLSVTWLGHSTVLVEAAGVRVLTDPLLRPRLGLLRRVAPPAAPLEGELDAVLVSHVHFDHLDVPSLRRLRARCFVVPRGARRVLERRGLEPVVELDEGGELTLGGLTVRATHAVHRARRGLRAPSARSLGFLLSGPARVYFAGDTEVFDGMRELAPLDLALLPVAGWGPRVGPGHLDPHGAAEALRLLRPRVAVPIHWGTYRRVLMSRDARALREPPERFADLARELAPEVDVRILAPGERLALEPAQAGKAAP
jgi:L-ascorbate metabolism protein UlaG (beta-lactamase superfamily)